MDVLELARGQKLVNYTVCVCVCVCVCVQDSKRKEQGALQAPSLLGERKTERFSVGRLLAYRDTN